MDVQQSSICQWCGYGSSYGPFPTVWLLLWRSCQKTLTFDRPFDSHVTGRNKTKTTWDIWVNSIAAYRLSLHAFCSVAKFVEFVQRLDLKGMSMQKFWLGRAWAGLAGVSHKYRLRLVGAVHITTFKRLKHFLGLGWGWPLGPSLDHAHATKNKEW